MPTAPPESTGDAVVDPDGMSPHPTVAGALVLPTATPVAMSFRGQLLPTPQPEGNAVLPPPAWLVVADHPTPASYSTFCYLGTCADYVQPQRRPELVRATLPAESEALIILGSGATPVTEVTASVQPWSDEVPPLFGSARPSADRRLRIVQSQERNALIFTLEPLGDASDQLLHIAVTFQEGSGASYLWRLNPQS